MGTLLASTIRLQQQPIEARANALQPIAQLSANDAAQRARAEPTETPSPTSARATWPSVDVFSLHKCATLTRAATSISASPTLLPEKVTPPDAASPTGFTTATASHSPTPSTTATFSVTTLTNPSPTARAKTDDAHGWSQHRLSTNSLSDLKGNSTVSRRASSSSISVDTAHEGRGLEAS